MLNIEQLFKSGAIEAPQRRIPAALVKAADFWQVFRQYKRWHGTRYALQRAYHIVYQGADF